MWWMIKVAADQVLSVIPGGEAVASFARKNITRTSYPTEGTVAHKMQVATDYLVFLHRLFRPHDLAQMAHVDIGCGWMPTIPLVFYSVGVQRQVLCDIRRNMKRDTVAETVRIFQRLARRSGQQRGGIYQRLPPLMGPQEELDEYFTRIGIRYFVPFKPRDLRADGARKLITATQVLLLLTPAELDSLLDMIAAALSDGGGIFLATVHLYDPYSDADPSLPRYNKYRYSDFVWDRIISSRLARYNRLTASDYRWFLEKHGFELLEFDLTKPTEADIRELRRVPLHPKFRHISETEMASPHLFFAAKPRGNHATVPVFSSSGGGP